MQSHLFKNLFIAILVVLFQVVAGNTADITCRTILYEDQSLQTVKGQFSAYDKIYLQSLCQYLAPGDHELSAVWHTPSGKIQRQDIHTFHLPVETGYSALFWMKLHKKSTLQDAASNGSFSDKYFGTWTVKVYLNEQSVGTATFSIQ